MLESQILPAVSEAVKLVLAAGIGGAVASCVGSWFVNKKLQTQKHAQDKQLESLKNEFGKKSTIHKLQFEKELRRQSKRLTAPKTCLKIIVLFITKLYAK